jgi:hypothetical protein
VRTRLASAKQRALGARNTPMAASKEKDERAQPRRLDSGTRPRATLDPGPDAEGPLEPQDAGEILRQLDEAALWLGRLPAGPLHRELKLTLERYRQTAAEWARSGLPPMRRRMLLKCVGMLRSAIARSVVDLDPAGSCPNKK